MLLASAPGSNPPWIVWILVGQAPSNNELGVPMQSRKDVTKFMNPTENRIELSSRRNILDAFLVTRISWYGNLEQANFLGRLFDLSKIRSSDTRYKTADQDIYK